ncbi:protein BatD, partial [bacterium]|nr:protein BatD [candidate division CSSED10-310 bacterium]
MRTAGRLIRSLPGPLVTVVILALLPRWVNVTHAADIRLSARVDRNHVTVYDRITYTLIVETTSRGTPDPIPPDFSGFQVLGPPRTSSQFSWINGRTTSTKSFTWTLQAKKDGHFTISPARIEYDGSVFQSTPVVVSVSKPGQGSTPGIDPESGEATLPAGQQGNLFLNTVVSTETPYVGEAVTVTTVLYTRVRVREYGMQALPDYEGFWMEESPLPETPVMSTKTIRGVEYAVAKLHEVILYPTVTGELTVPPVSMAFDIQSQQRDPFDDFFNSPFRSGFFGNRRETRSSQAVTLQVRPLPINGRPPMFSGAVGTFEMAAELNTPRVHTGEPVVIRLTLSGQHGLKTLTAPEPPAMQNFKIFDPKSGEIEPDPVRPGHQRRMFEYIFVPHVPGNYTIPSFQFACFDPKTGRYRVLESAVFDVAVDPAPGSAVLPGETFNQRSVQRFNTEIRYIKTGITIRNGSAPYRHPMFFLLLLSPVIGAPLVLAVDRHRRRLAGDSAYAREVRARSVSGRRFAEAQKRLSAGVPDAALDAAAAAFTRYLADRLALPPGGIVQADVLRELAVREGGPDVLADVEMYWKEIDAMRFAPVELSGADVQDVIVRGQDLVDRLERLKL